MWCSLDTNGIYKRIIRQLSNYWDFQFPKNVLYASIETALQRLEKNFAGINNKYYRKDNEIVFRMEHTVQYSIFLYFLSNQLYKDGVEEAAAYIYYLNKIMHSVDWFYAIELPENFYAEHPMGCVLGRAQFGNYFFVHQGVTVGEQYRGGVFYRPKIKDYVVMYPDSKVIGDCIIGNKVLISANTYIKDTNIPDNSIVFGQSPNLIIKKNQMDRINEILDSIWVH